MKKTFEFGSGRLRGKVGIIAERKDGKDLLKDLLGQFSKGDGRGNVVMVRINDDALARIDQLVEASLFGSPSDRAAFLIGAGIASQKELFDRLGAHTDEIRKLKEPLRQAALDAQNPHEQNRPIAKRTQFSPLFATKLKRQANSASRPVRLRTPPPHYGMADAAALTPASPSDRTAAGPCRPAMCAPVCTPTEIFDFLFFCYCLCAKRVYSMDDCAPTTGGVHNV